MNNKGFLLVESLLSFFLIVSVLIIMMVMIKTYQDRKVIIKKQQFVLEMVKNYQEIHCGDCFFFSDLTQVRELNSSFTYFPLENGYEYCFYYNDQLMPASSSYATFYFELRYEHLIVNQKDVYRLFVQPFIYRNQEVVYFFSNIPIYAIAYD